MGLSLTESKAGTVVTAQRLLPSSERLGMEVDLGAVGELGRIGFRLQGRKKLV